MKYISYVILLYTIYFVIILNIFTKVLIPNLLSQEILSNIMPCFWGEVTKNTIFIFSLATKDVLPKYFVSTAYKFCTQNPLQTL